MQTWGLVATLDEPAALVAGFVAHHLTLGASEIHLYLDRPDPHLAALLSDLDKVHVTQCTDGYWAKNGRLFWTKTPKAGQRPKVHVQRQAVNAQHAYARAQVDWLMHCDGDEFLAAAPGAIGQELGSYPPTIEAARILNSERAWLEGQSRSTIFDGVARRPFRRGGGGLFHIYGAAQPYLNQGVLGYTNAKCFTRTGRDLFLGIHRPKPRDDDGPTPDAKVATWDSRTIELVHFDGLTPRHWMVKLLRKAQEQGADGALSKRLGAPRMAQLNAIREAAGSADALWDLHDLLRVLPKDVEVALRDLNQVQDVPMDVVGAAGRILPDAALDFSERAFDVWLAEKAPDAFALAPK